MSAPFPTTFRTGNGPSLLGDNFPTYLTLVVLRITRSPALNFLGTTFVLYFWVALPLNVAYFILANARHSFSRSRFVRKLRSLFSSSDKILRGLGSKISIGIMASVLKSSRKGVS